MWSSSHLKRCISSFPAYGLYLQQCCGKGYLEVQRMSIHFIEYLLRLVISFVFMFGIIIVWPVFNYSFGGLILRSILTFSFILCISYLHSVPCCMFSFTDSACLLSRWYSYSVDSVHEEWIWQAVSECMIWHVPSSMCHKCWWHSCVQSDNTFFTALCINELHFKSHSYIDGDLLARAG
jgi:hypothetical protein